MDKSKLVANRVGLNTGEVEIEGVGTITVRGLSRYEFLVASKKYPDDNLLQERFILAAAMVDPEMTEGDVADWQKASPPAEINAVAVEVNRLSGIGKGADKSGVSGLRDGTGA
jgi:hypothetical protein